MLEKTISRLTNHMTADLGTYRDAYDANPFSGTYVGGGHTISGLKIDAARQTRIVRRHAECGHQKLTIESRQQAVRIRYNEKVILVGHYRTDAARIQ